jgi:hypothetical protein
MVAAEDTLVFFYGRAFGGEMEEHEKDEGLVNRRNSRCSVHARDVLLWF